MAGGLMQLVAYGAQDIYLTGNPQITFFKVVYRRHTNFSIEAVVQAFNGDIKSATSATATCTIARGGDLISNMWLDVKMAGQGTAVGPAYCNWINNTGCAFIDNCEIEIGGQLIDKQYGMWLDIWNELTDRNNTEWQGLNKHPNNLGYINSNHNLDHADQKLAGANQALQLYIPFKFWFCKNPGLALPLVALQYHEVKFKLTTRGMAGLVAHKGTATSGLTALKPATCDLWVDYIYLDTDEKRRFAQVSHEYLIEQVQRNTGDSAVNNVLNFDHPVKEIIWVLQHTTPGTAETDIDVDNDVLRNIQSEADTVPPAKNDYFNYSAGATTHQEYLYNNPGKEWFSTGQLQLNGEDRFALRNATYFRTCQPAQSGHLVPGKRIYCYSFALRPEEHQPSGTCNFSRLDSAKLVLTSVITSSIKIYIFAINYNVLRIMSGMGGLAYSS